MSDTLQPPPSAEAPIDEQARDASADAASPQPEWPAWPAEAADPEHPEPVRVPILSATPAAPPAEQRLPAPVPTPQHNYPQPYPQPYPPQRPQAAPPAPYTPQAVAVAEAPSESMPDLYAPPPPKPQSRFWKAVKWPIRQAIKGIYLLFSAAGRHKVVTAIILGTLLLFTLGGVTIYRALHPDSIDAHIATQANLPPLPTSVKQWIEGYRTFNGQEAWNALSLQGQQLRMQQGSSEEAIQSSLDQLKAAGVEFQESVYTGGYVTPAGTGQYMVTMKGTQNGQSGVVTWFFMTDSTGKIALAIDTTPQNSSSSSSQ
jgi:hypothetical protein